MSVLIHIPSSFQTPEFEIMLARVQSEIDKGENAIVVGCRGGGGLACSFNIHGLVPICFICHRQRRRGLSLLKGTFSYLDGPEADRYSSSVSVQPERLNSRWTTKVLMYRGVDVGQAAYSSYIGSTRDLDLEGVLARRALRRLIQTSEALTEYFFELLLEGNFSKVILFNGRQNQSRPLLRVAQQLGIRAEVMEAAGRDAHCVYQFDDCLPQDLKKLAVAIERNWDSYEGNREADAQQYFDYKRQGGAINDRSYVQGQQEGLLPDGWDPSLHNIVIFNSSEDELAALGGEYDEVVYPSQFIAINRICESLADKSGIRIYLRVHPNLGTVRWAFAEGLKQLHAVYPNAEIISAESPVSSYALLDACSVILSFGSTIGIEAAYWGKPSILVGRSLYENTGSVYAPRSHEAVVELLQNRNLPPLGNLGAKKVGLFWAQGGKTINHFGGSRDGGFTFDGQCIRKPVLERVFYMIWKGIERWIIGDLINYHAGRWWFIRKRRLKQTSELV